MISWHSTAELLPHILPSTITYRSGLFKTIVPFLGLPHYACSSVGKNFLVYRTRTRNTVIPTIIPTQKTDRN